MKGPARKPIKPIEVELHLDGLFARWQHIHGKAALQLLKIAELVTRSRMKNGTVAMLKKAAVDLDAWCSIYYAGSEDWQRLKTYVRVNKHKAARGDKKGFTGDLFA